jgi:hypothetical protein
MESFKVKLKVGRYIAHPFWSATDALVNIQKSSGYKG